MRNKFTLILSLGLLFALGTSAFAFNGNPGPLVLKPSNSVDVENQLNGLLEMNSLIESQNLNFDALKEVSPTKVADVNLSNSASEEFVVKGGSDAPLGIPGFVWGFVLGLVGIVIVYVAMDEGSDRKKEVKNAIWGCVASAVVFSLLYFVLLGSLFVSNDAQPAKQNVSPEKVVYEQRA